MLSLDTKNRPLSVEIVSIGSLNVNALTGRDVFRPALLANACAVIVAHNHPSGDPTPSPEDVAMTRHLVAAGKMLGIELLDHLVMASDRYRSLREQGDWEPWTRKDYRAIADAIRRTRLDMDGKTPEQSLHDLILRLNVVFANDNPRFRSQRFWDACE